MEVVITPDSVTLTGASGGSAEDNGFQVSTSNLGIVIGFSLTGTTNAAGSSGVLTSLMITKFHISLIEQVLVIQKQDLSYLILIINSQIRFLRRG